MDVYSSFTYNNHQQMDKQIVICIKSGTMKGFEISLCWPAGEFFCYSFTVTGGRCSPAYIRQSWFVTQSNTLPHFSLQSHWVPGHCLQTSECPLRGSTWRPGSCWQTCPSPALERSTH